MLPAASARQAGHVYKGGQYDGAMTGTRKKSLSPSPSPAASLAKVGPTPIYVAMRDAKLSIINWAYMRNTQARCDSAEFRCQFPAAAPKFRCRQAGKIVFKYLIYNIFSTLGGTYR